MAVLLVTPVIGAGLLLVEAISFPLVGVEDEEVRARVLEAGTGIFEGFENEPVVKGWSKIFFDGAPSPPPTLLEPSPLLFVLVMGFSARTGGLAPFDVLFSLSFAVRSDVFVCCTTPVPVVGLVRLVLRPEDESRDFANELAVGARSVEEERFKPALPVPRPAPMLLLPLTLLSRLLAVPSVLVKTQVSDSRFH